MRSNTSKRLSRAQQRQRSEAAAGLALIFMSLCGMGWLLIHAAAVDASRGISVAQSLATWGL